MIFIIIIISNDFNADIDIALNNGISMTRMCIIDDDSNDDPLMMMCIINEVMMILLQPY